MRRLTKAAAVAAVFALGGVVGWAVKPAATVQPAVGEPVFVFVPLPEPVPVPTPTPGAAGMRGGAPGSPRPVLPEQTASARQLELRAEQTDDPKEAARL